MIFCIYRIYQSEGGSKSNIINGGGFLKFCWILGIGLQDQSIEAYDQKTNDKFDDSMKLLYKFSTWERF